MSSTNSKKIDSFFWNELMLKKNVSKAQKKTFWNIVLMKIVDDPITFWFNSNLLDIHKYVNEIRITNNALFRFFERIHTCCSCKHKNAYFSSHGIIPPHQKCSSSIGICANIPGSHFNVYSTKLYSLSKNVVVYQAHTLLTLT